ncbi:CMP-sialic acid transporter 2 [Dichanthelium oligosanthes]|uniref:CMP-sialic acid transporter 2 n=1 Tax=Dichanthelium oligosanthes TaxID=888268 RepID=A0A1E5WGH3_9POAL|nr:CMP-sialic acid transporter 2 [Dichanthelium oligosanthes]
MSSRVCISHLGSQSNWSTISAADFWCWSSEHMWRFLGPQAPVWERLGQAWVTGMGNSSLVEGEDRLYYVVQQSKKKPTIDWERYHPSVVSITLHYFDRNIWEPIPWATTTDLQNKIILFGPNKCLVVPKNRHGGMTTNVKEDKIFFLAKTAGGEKCLTCSFIKAEATMMILQSTFSNYIETGFGCHLGNGSCLAISRLVELQVVVGHGVGAALLAEAYRCCDAFYARSLTEKQRARRRPRESYNYSSSFTGRFECRLPWKETLSLHCPATPASESDHAVADYFVDALGRSKGDSLENSNYPFPGDGFLSGFAGVYKEGIIKKRPSRNINMQNFWLLIFGMLFNLVAICVQDFDAVINKGFFCFLCSGIAVSMVMKYVDIIVKAPNPSSGPHKSRECLPLTLIIRNRLENDIPSGLRQDLPCKVFTIGKGNSPSTPMQECS